jgi:PAS domain S-box-containing protein
MNAEHGHQDQSFHDEVVRRFGVLPNFFCSAPAAEGLVQELWKFAKAGYLDSPLPPLFKERLFVHLSRFCEVRYCIVRHVGFLIGQGRPAGDASVLPQTIDEVLELLRRPLPDADRLALCFGRLETEPPAVEMPGSNTQREGDLFDALTVVFVEPRHSERARLAVAGAFGERHFEILTAFLAFVRTAHFWTETHPALPYEPDVLAVMAKEPDLARLLLNVTEAHQARESEALRRTLAELRAMQGERARVERALRATEAQLTAVLRAAHMAYWEWDPTTDTLSASDTMDELFGLPPAQKIRNRAQGYALVHPEDLPQHHSGVNAATREGETWHHQFRIIRPCDAQVAWLEERAHATRDPQTGRVSVAGLVWDVTKRKQLESSLQESDRRKDEFLATLAHELRNPLAALRNGLEIARVTTTADSPFQRTLQMMDRQLTHLVHLVDDLLDVGRISSGKIELHRNTIALPDLLTSSVEAARAAIDKHGHVLIVESGTEELWVKGDFDRLTQIFANLLTNSAKYTNPGGKIELRATREGDTAAVSVTDNGIGIPAADLPQLFEMFSQVGLHKDRSEGGLGIGLSLVRKLVDLHQGSVSAKSEGSGKGSTFTVRLPLAMAGATPDNSLSIVPRRLLAPRRILVVDDNEDAANSLAALLRYQGHEVAIAYTAEEGIASARSVRPDLAFLDLGMPRMDGVEAAVHLRSIVGATRMVLVALTGWGHEHDLRRTRRAGFDHHLLKPIDPAELNEILSAAPT